MHKSIKEREQEIIDEQSKMESMNSEELEIKRLREAQKQSSQRTAENVSISDLFNKYNI